MTSSFKLECDMYPNGTEIFTGITQVRFNNQWQTKGTFVKVVGIPKFKKDKVIKKEENIPKEIQVKTSVEEF